MRLTYITAAAIAAFGLVACGKKEEAGEVVATVNGESVTAADYHDYLERKSTVVINTAQGPQLAQSVGTVGLQGLRDMVDRRLVLQMAKEDGLVPTEADINAELDRRTKEQPNYANLLITQAGMTTKLIRNDIMFDLARERLQTKGVTVSPAEVDTYIRENKDQFMEPAKANLLWVMVSDPNKKTQVDRDLSTGQNFQAIATRYSEAPQARESGGAFPTNEVSRFPKVLQDLVAKTSKLKATDWIKDGKNWLKFYVQDKTPAKAIEMTAERKDQLRRQLAMQKGRSVNNLGQRLQDRLKNSEVKVTPPHLATPWSKLMEQLKKETTAGANPSATGSPAPGAVPGGPPAGGAAPK